MHILKNKYFEGDTAPKSTYWTFAICTGFKDTLFQFISLFLLLYVQFGTSLSKEADFQIMFSVITLGIVIIKIVAPTLFVFIPYIMNKIHFKSGRFRPWILLGALISISFFLFIFFIPLEGWAYVITFLITYFLFELTFGVEDSAFWGFMPTMTNDEKKRSFIASTCSVFSCAGSYILSATLPAITGGHAATTIKWIAIIVSTAFVITQIILTLVMKEKAIKKVNTENSKILDTFRVFFKNKYCLIGNVCFGLAFLVQFIIVGLSANYFYFNCGYGTSTIFNSLIPSGGIGGAIFIFTIIYGIAYVIGFSTYPILIKKFNRKQILTVSIFVSIIGHISMFSFLMNRDMLIPLFISSFFIFYFQSLISGVYTMAASLPLEYHELKYFTHREVEFFTIRAIVVKYASSFQTAFFYLTLLASGLLSLNTQIGTFEGMGVIDKTFDVISNVNNAITDVLTSSNYDYHLIIYRAGMFLLPALLLLLSYFLYCKFYDLDETKHAEIVEELKNRTI